MNGEIAQIVALTLHGNKFLQDEEVESFFPDHSTCQYCEFVKFVEWIMDENDVWTTNEIVGTPNEWYKYLKSKKAVGIRIFLTPQNENVAEDRNNAGFVGGGGIWEMVVTYDDGKIEILRPKWITREKKDTNGRKWQVMYGFYKLAPKPDMGNDNIDETYKRLINALENINKYSKPHETLKRYTERFSSALNVLINVDHNLELKKYIYHNDLYPGGFLDKKAMAIMSACQMSYVFGGMGSWNDLPPHDGNYNEYQRVSDELFLAINEGFIVATNSSFKNK